MITHIVLVKFTPDATPEQKSLWRDEVVALSKKSPQVQSIRYGNKVIAFERLRQSDPGWDDGMVMTFESLKDLQTYATGEPHDIYLAATASFTKEKLIYDIES